MKRSPEQKRRIGIGIALLIMFVVTFVAFYNVNEKAEQHAWERLFGAAQSADTRVNDYVRKNETILGKFAEYLTKNEKDLHSEAVAQMIRNIKLNREDSPVRLYLPDGSVVLEDGTLSKNARVLTYPEIVSAQPFVTMLHEDSINPEKRIIEQFVPIEQNGVIVGMLSLVVDPDKLHGYKYITEYNGQAEFFLFDRRDMYAFIDTEKKKGSDISSLLQENTLVGISSAELEQKIKDGEKCNFSYIDKETGVEKYMCIMPSEKMPTWMVAVEADKNVIFASVKDLRQIFFVALFLEIITLLWLLAWHQHVTSMEVAQASSRYRDLSKLFQKSYTGIYRVDLRTDTYEMISKGNIIEDAVYDMPLFSEHIGHCIENLVVKEDRANLYSKSSIEYMRAVLQEHDSYLYRFRVIFGKEVRWYEMRVDALDENHAMVGFVDRHDRILAELLNKKIQNDFVSIYIINPGEDYIRAFLRSNEQVGGSADQHSFRQWAKNLVERVSPEARGFWGKFTRIGYLCEFLSEEDRREFVFKIPGREGEWFRAVFYVLGRKDGKPGTVALSFTALDRMMAESQQLALQIEEQNAELEMQREALERALAMANSASKAKTTFLNNMSHDIRTPMNAIIGFTSMAAKVYDQPTKVQDYLRKVSGASKHLLALINDVLDMSRIESGKVVIKEEKESLADIMHRLRDIIIGDITGKHQELFIDTIDVSDEMVYCDCLRLNQVFLNLVSNAIKYTPEGGTILVRVTQKERKDTGYGVYEFSVKDNGIGMTKEFLETVFEPFTREKSSTLSGVQGTGLGMAITKNIIDMMAGEIAVESEVGKGTEFRVTIPLKLADQSKEIEKIKELEGIRSLVVDDDIYCCKSVALMLRKIGLRAEWTRSGTEAVVRTEEAQQLGDTFGIYVIDWQMPGIDGIETVRQIRKRVGKDSPILLLSAYDYTDIEEEAREAGVTDFLNKPVFLSDLTAVLKRNSEGRRLSVKQEAEDGAVEKPSFEGMHVLLVEDVELNREVAEDFLTDRGMTLDMAENGAIAVDMVKNSKPGFYQLILMDIQMPVMDGYEATRRIRALEDKALSRIPIVAMTANAFEEDRQAAFEAGMNEHIAKPIDGERIDTVLKMLFHR